MRFSCASCDIEKTVNLDDDPTPSCPNCGGTLQIQTRPTASQFSDSLTSEFGEQESPGLKNVEAPLRIGKYRIVGHVATGGFGAVYKGYDSILDRYVAIKIPKKEKLTGKRADDFINEARTMAKLEHHNIVPILEAGRDDSQNVFLVMKWIDGLTLAEHANQHDPTVDEIRELMSKVCQAIHFAHKAGFVHRDLKPSNILIDQNGEPYVCDFGLAIHDSNQALVRNQVAGTVSYMSPEQIEGRAHHLDGRTDIWSIGVILYELLCRKKPFVAESKEALFEAILERPLKPLEQQIDGIPEALVQLVSKCLVKDVNQRIPSAKIVAQVLNDLDHGFEPDESSVHRIGPSSSSASSRGVGNLVKIGIAVVLLIGIGAAAIWYFNSPKRGSVTPQGTTKNQPDNTRDNAGQVAVLTNDDAHQFKILSPSELQISATRNTLVRVGNAVSDEYWVEFEINHRWIASSSREKFSTTNGDVGFFIGLKDGWLQLFLIGMDGNDSTKFQVRRTIAKFDKQHAYVQSSSAGMTVIGEVEPKKPLKVRFRVKDGRLMGGNINGADIDQGIVRNERGWHANTKGQFGFFVCDTVCVFQNLKFSGKKFDYHD